MNDCYRILGVSRYASPVEIRAAFLARMKVCHPDAGGAAAQEAAEISQAYWQLRDAHRRSEHDLLVFAPPPISRRPVRARSKRKVSLAKAAPRARRDGRAKAPVGAKSSRNRPRARRLDPVRAAAGVAACSLAVIGFAMAATHFGGHGTVDAHAAVAGQNKNNKLEGVVRRPLDTALASAAAKEFRTIVAQTGVAGAHLYARQCLMELAARPSMTMLDYCLAFDDEASAWEKAPKPAQEPRRYFAPDQRFGRYAHAAREMAPGPVRETMLTEVSYFAAADD